MTKRSTVIALVLSLASSAAAQSKKVPPVVAAPCDTAGQLARSPEIKGALRATLNKTCGSYQILLSGFDTTWTGAQLIAYALHGKPPFTPPPKDTTTIPPRDTTKVPPVDTTPAPIPAQWVTCTNAGAMCYFLGLRVVRLADATNTKFVTQTAYHVVPCAGYGFGNQFPSQGQLHCDYGPALLDTLAVPAPMGPITKSTIIVPKGSRGSATKDVQTGGGNGSRVDGTGSFRVTSSLVKFAFDDPIVWPKQAGKSHLHMFFGNVDINPFTDSTNVAACSHSSTRGGILNCSGYWTPAMIDASGNAVMPDEATFYYKTGYNMPPAKTQVLPTGLRMIAGDVKATGPQVAPGPLPISSWDCMTPALGAVKVNGQTIETGYTIPGACPMGAMVRLTIFFPSCWNGKDLDSPTHKTHMAYPNFAAGACPATHPVQVPQISEHFDWPVQKGMNPATWHLSSDMDLSKPGMSAHADWMMGWDVETMRSLVVNCLQKALDCGVGGIGANKSLY